MARRLGRVYWRTAVIAVLMAVVVASASWWQTGLVWTIWVLAATVVVAVNLADYWRAEYRRAAGQPAAAPDTARPGGR